MNPRTDLPALPLHEKTAWWKACFEEVSRRQQAAHVRARVDGLDRYLQLEPRSRVLDLGCGLGQETIELARRGHRVLGIDDSEERLREARQEIKGTGLFCHFLKADTRNIPYTGDFDAVLLRHPSFGSFSKEREDLKTLENVAKALKPGGRLVLKLVNRDWVMRHLPLVSPTENLRFDFATGRLESGRPSLSAKHSFRLYALTEVLRLLKEAGLEFRQVWGRMDGSPYNLDSFHMVVLAAKPKDAPRPRERDDDGLVRAIKIKGRGR